MRAIILAGGLGTRLQSKVPNLPKPLAPIGKRPFLEYQLDYWISKGITQFYLSIGYLAEKIRSHFNHEYRGAAIHYVQEPAPLGTGGAIAYVLKHLQNSDEEVCVLNGDTFVEIDFNQMLKQHQTTKADLTIALRKVEKNDRYSGVMIDSNNQIVKFAHRDEKISELLINAGVYLFKPHFFLNHCSEMPSSFSVEDDFFPTLIQKSASYAYISEGRFIDIGVPQDYERATQFFKDVSQVY